MKKLLCVLILFFCAAFNADAGWYYSAAAAGGCAGGSDGYIGQENDNGGYQVTEGPITIWTPFTPTEDGTVTYCHVSVNYSSNYANIGIWDSSGTLLKDSTEYKSLGNNNNVQTDYTLDSELCLETGVTYWIGFTSGSSDTNWVINGYATGGNGIHYDNTDVQTGTTLGNVSQDGTFSSTYQMLIWCDNSPN